jgi:peptidylprolyl isomerase
MLKTALSAFGVLLVVAVIGVAVFWHGPTASVANTAATADQFASSTSADATQTPEQTQAPSVQAAPQQVTNSQPNPTIMHATLHTNKGDITFEFDPQLAPNAVANFIKLAQSGFYDGTKFHRVIKGFMDQGGDPLSKDDSKMAQWGMGGPGYQFADEITPQSLNNAGTVAMANSGPNTNGSQFYINAVNNNFLDGKYVVFAHVTAGMDVVTAINNVPTGANDRPVQPVVVNSVTVSQ